MRGSAPGERRGGRQRGVKNRRTAALAQAQAEAAEKIAAALGPAAFSGDAHAFLQTIYKDGALAVELRLVAARAAIPYEKPRLAVVTLEDKPCWNLENLSDAELENLMALERKMGAPPTNSNESFLAVVNALDDAAKAKVLQDFEAIARKVLAKI